MQNNYQNHEGKERNFDEQSSIQIDPHDNNVEREDIESNENRKQKMLIINLI